MGKRINVKPDQTKFGAPPKALTPYFAFCGGQRDKVIQDLRVECEKEGKSLSITDSGRRLKKLWDEAGAEVKTELQQEYVANKEAYEVKIVEWKLTDGYKGFLEAKRVYEMKDGAKKARKAAVEAGQPKKPDSAYFLFGNKKRQEIIAGWKAEGKKTDIRLLASIIAAAWKEVTVDDKKPYEEEAAKSKVEYDVKLAEFKTTDAYQEFRKSVEKTSEKSARSKKEIKQVGKEPVEKKERKPRAPKLDAEGNEIPMKARVRRAKKEVASATEAPPAEVANAPDVPMDVIPAAQ